MRRWWLVVRGGLLGVAIGCAWSDAEKWMPKAVWYALSFAAVFAIWVWVWRTLREIKQNEREARAMLAHLNRTVNARWN
jgi:hypothetical protein